MIRIKGIPDKNYPSPFDPKEARAGGARWSRRFVAAMYAEIARERAKNQRPPLIRLKLTLERVYLNQGGYTPKGEYFGVGEPLYQYQAADWDFVKYPRENFDVEVCECVRAENREAAKAQIREKYRSQFEISFYR